jgi:hypothetical protein
MSRTRRANDEDESTLRFVTFLKNRLSPEDMERLKKMLDDKAEEMGEDSPPAFEGKPKPGGAMAADSRGKNYEDRFPMAVRIGLV